MTDHFFPRGTLADGVLDVGVRPDGVDWRYTGLDVVTLAPGESWAITLDGREGIVVPLAGGCTVAGRGER